MAKYSVKKPLTVFVAVIAVLVLGVVAFLNMTPDLLPNINMPYVVIVTPYPGATPEKVELSVTRPLEQSMATLENIENINSTSSENSSVLILEFNNDVNMDTITVDILQRVTQLQPYWDDMVGSPYIMKLNPSMLPVMVAAVDMEEMDTAQLSYFVNNTLLNELEGTPGVASISAQGMLEETVHVVLNQQKIDAVNRSIRVAVEDEFREAEDELNDTKDELQEVADKADDAEMPSEDSFDMDLEGLEGLGEGDGAGMDMDDAMSKAADAKREIAKKEQELQQGKDLLQENITKLEEGKAELESTEQLLATVAEGYAELQTQKKNAEDAITALMDLAMAISTTPGYPLAPEDVGLLLATGVIDQATADDLLVNPTNYTTADLVTGITDAATQLGMAAVAADAAIAALEDTLKEMGIELAADPNALKKALASITEGKLQMDAALVQLRGTLEQLQQGAATLSQVKTELEIQMNEGMMQMLEVSLKLGGASMQLGAGALEAVAATGQAMAGAQAKMALQQIESGLEQLESAKEQALKQADLNNILTMDMVSTILTAQNFAMPVGYVAQDGVQTMVSVGDEITSVEELRGLLIMDMGLDGVAPIYLTDVADIYMADNSGDIYAKINGNDGVLLTFQKQSTYATATVSDNIMAKFAELSEEYDGLAFYPMMDQGDYIYIVIESILSNLLWGALFAVLVLFLFLKDIRPTAITLVSIPISVIFAIGLMYFSGISINIISLSGLAVAVGMLVDNSVVVIENIYRLRAKGVPAAKAAVAGASQVAGAIAASTLTTICVFFPIVFVEGLTRQLFADLALTLGYSLMASLIVALTLVPAMGSKLLVNSQPKESKWLDKMLGTYQSSLRWVLRHKAVVLLATVVLLVASFALVLVRGFAFMPAMEMDQLTMTVTMPEESTAEDTKKLTDIVLERIQTIDGVETTGAMLDSGGIMGFGLGGSSEMTSSIYVLLDEEAESRSGEIGDEILQKVAGLPAEIEVSNSSGMSLDALSGSGVSVKLFGNDMAELQTAARQVAAAMEELDGTVEVSDGIGDTSAELRFVVDKEKAMKEGLTTAQVYMELSTALATEKTSTRMSWGQSEYDVIIINGDESLLTPEYVKNLTVTVTDREGEEKEIPILNLAHLEETETRDSISRENQRRLITVSAGIAQDHNVSLVATEIESLLEKESLPPGVSYEFSGENESIMEAFSDLLLMLLLGVVLVYLIMVAQFQSLKSPFIVMFTIPLAFTGGMLALLITGMELSVIALIGFVMLVGIIVNNGIVLVDYINQLRAEGASRQEAIVEAGVTRMRPILMTTITTILGLFTMALGIGTGAALMQPIAIVCIGGLTYATLLTLYVVPIIYDMLNKRDVRVLRDEDLTYDEEESVGEEQPADV